jgi:hypothetical protein
MDFYHELNKFDVERIKAELSELDRETVDADGVRLKPSQCYHFEADPLHVLFNTNCPDTLKRRVQEIISRHIIN